MTTLLNDRFLRAIRREPVDMTPIWIMRQAGRYLPEYREVRQKAGSFMQLCKTPELACQVTLQPLARFPLDAAILFSDILTIPDAMGLGLHFKEGEGPCFERPVQTAKAIQALTVPDPHESLSYVLDAIKMIRHELAGKAPLIGFCGSPWTIATYMVQGHANKSFPLIQKMLREEPQLLHQLLDTLAKSVSAHLNAQINAGVQAVMIFDTWGGMLDTTHYQTFSLHYVKQVIMNLMKEHQGQPIPVILFTKEGGQWLELMTQTGCDMLGVDWLTSLKDARARVGSKVALQGNLDPKILLSSPETIRAEVARVLEEYGAGSGHVFNLGHGITPDVPPDNVAVLVDAVHGLSRRYHL
ncbi:MAG: uroporphyrinogen decarboxylase [Gammaproteobacteria bacterium]